MGRQDSNGAGLEGHHIHTHLTPINRPQKTIFRVVHESTFGAAQFHTNKTQMSRPVYTYGL